MIKELLQQLDQFPHRGPTTEYESKSADLLENAIIELELSPIRQAFNSPSTKLFEVNSIIILLIIGLTINLIDPITGTIVCSIAGYFFYSHYSGTFSLLTKFLPKKKSQNIFGIVNNPDAKQTILLLAHYDTSQTIYYLSPKRIGKFRKIFIASFILVVLSSILGLFGVWLNENNAYQVITGLFVTYFAFSITLLNFFLKKTTKHGLDANNNKAGIAAILDIAADIKDNPLKNSRMIILFVGCNGTGSYGSRAFIERYSLDIDSTFVINFDITSNGSSGEVDKVSGKAYGKAGIRYCTGEGMMGYFRHDHQLIEHCQKITKLAEFKTISPIPYHLSSFDTTPFLRKSYKTLSLITTDDNGYIPYRNRSENIDDIVCLATQFGLKLIKEIDSQAV